MTSIITSNASYKLHQLRIGGLSLRRIVQHGVCNPRSIITHRLIEICKEEKNESLITAAQLQCKS